ncbi:MAG TPA: ABC transporter permease [Chitinophagaceae bacterium]|nr:ABC transporter permease [Chitinophagaceae bacterium]
MLAITKASLRAILRSPSAIVFSIFFPLIFILVFGFIGSGGGPTYRIVLDSKSDTTNAILDSLRSIKNVRFVSYKNEKTLQSDLNKGRIAGILEIEKSIIPNSNFTYFVRFKTTTASADRFSSFFPLLENIVTKIDKANFENRQTIGQIVPEVKEVRKYRTIDFILPGQLGFSLLSAGIFGVAFLFFSLRKQLVLKRFYATPIRRGYIVLGEGISRVIFQLLTAIIIIGIGYFAFNFTLVNGWITFFEIMILSFIALLVFMGMGFIVSGVAKNESAIPPLANLITMPQFLLAGTFFSIDVFPKWLQPISKALPLTYFNDAMRKISFEGVSLMECGVELAVLTAWGIVSYAIAIKVFKWE